MADPARVAGLFESLARLAGTLVAIAQTRLRLLAADVEEGRQQLLSLLALALAAGLAVGIGAVLGTLAVVMSFPESQRTLVIGVLAGAYLALGGLVWWIALRRMRTQPRPFAASLAELGKDRQSLSSG